MRTVLAPKPPRYVWGRFDNGSSLRKKRLSRQSHWDRARWYEQAAETPPSIYWWLYFQSAYRQNPVYRNLLTDRQKYLLGVRSLDWYRTGA